MRETLVALTILASTCTASFAQTLTFEADEGVVIVRSYDQFGHAVIEVIGKAGAFHQCLALASDGTPLATATAMADTGQMMIQGLVAKDIHDVKCRRTM